jgi:polypeptide N-acetylgalactosaminyltransferase
LKGLLEYYVYTRLPRKVKIVRLLERNGLVRAKLRGAAAASGDVLVFLDSHCECNVGWLEPLLQRIKEERRAVLVPVISVIDDGTMAYPQYKQVALQVGGFTWSGHFTWINPIEPEVKRRGDNSLMPMR